MHAPPLPPLHHLTTPPTLLQRVALRMLVLQSAAHHCCTQLGGRRAAGGGQASPPCVHTICRCPARGPWVAAKQQATAAAPVCKAMPRAPMHLHNSAGVPPNPTRPHALPCTTQASARAQEQFLELISGVMQRPAQGTPEVSRRACCCSCCCFSCCCSSAAVRWRVESRAGGCSTAAVMW